MAKHKAHHCGGQAERRRCAGDGRSLRSQFAACQVAAWRYPEQDHDARAEFHLVPRAVGRAPHQGHCVIGSETTYLVAVASPSIGVGVAVRVGWSVDVSASIHHRYSISASPAARTRRRAQRLSY